MKKSIQSVFLVFVILMILLNGCTPALKPVSPTFAPSSTPIITSTSVPTPTPTPIHWLFHNYPIISPDNFHKLTLIKSFEIPAEFGVGAPYDVYFAFPKQDDDNQLIIQTYYWADNSVSINLESGFVSSWTGILSPNGKLVANSSRGSGYNRSFTPSLTVYEAQNPDSVTFSYSGKCSEPMYYDGCYYQVLGISSDSKSLITAGTFKYIYLWDIANGVLLAQYGAPKWSYYSSPAILSPDETKMIIYTHESVRVNKPKPMWYLFSIQPFEKLCSAIATPSSVNGATLMSFSPDNEKVAVSLGNNITVLKVSDCSVIHKIDLVGGISGMTYLPDGNHIVATRGGSRSGNQIALINATTGELVASFSGGIRGSNITISPDGKFLLITRTLTTEEASANKNTQLEVYAIMPD